MKKRVQLTIGPQTQKLIVKVCRQNNKITGLNQNSVDVIAASVNLGLDALRTKLLPTEKSVTSIRD